jgi:hypothetical protein
MITERQRLARRANARASTGPQTALGKARASRNACKHGLAVPIASDRRASRQMAFLVEKLAGRAPGVHELIERFVEAQLDLNRIRHARHELVAAAFNNPNFRSRKSAMRRSWQLHVLSRKLYKTPSAVTAEDLQILAPRTLEGGAKYVEILSEYGKTLTALARYERRAASRRKSAVRALDAVGFKWPTVLDGDLLKLIGS